MAQRSGESLVSDIDLIHGPQNLWGKFDSSIRIRPPCQENILYQPLTEHKSMELNRGNLGTQVGSKLGKPCRMWASNNSGQGKGAATGLRRTCAQQ